MKSAPRVLRLPPVLVVVNALLYPTVMTFARLSRRLMEQGTPVMRKSDCWVWVGCCDGRYINVQAIII